MLDNVPDDILDLGTAVVARQVKIWMDSARTKFAQVPDGGYDVGFVMKTSRDRVLMKLRITMGDITVRESAWLRAGWGDRKAFSEALDELVIKAVIQFTARCVQK